MMQIGDPLDDDAIAKIGAPPVLRDSAPPQRQSSAIDKKINKSNERGGGAGGTDAAGGSSPQLSKDAMQQLRQLDSSPARVDATAHRHRSAGDANGNVAATRNAVQEKLSNLGGGTAGSAAGSGKDKALSGGGVILVNEEYIDTQRELQDEEDEIAAMVAAQRKAAAEGSFLEAHRLLKQVKDAAKEHQLHVEKDMHYSKLQALLSSREVTHSHRDKLMVFTSEWERQLGELERRAAEERNDLAGRHQRELAEQEEIIRHQIAARTVNQKSKALTDAQQTTLRLASQQFYFEAHQAQRYEAQLEQREQAEKEKRMLRELARRMNALRSAKAKEMAALEARIESAREAMLTQRARDYEVLILKQHNKQVSDEQKVRVEFGQRRTAMTRKMVGLETRMGKQMGLATNNNNNNNNNNNKSEDGGSKPNTPSMADGHHRQQKLYRYGFSNNSNSGGGGTPRTGKRSNTATPSSASRNNNNKMPATSASAQGRHILVPIGIDYGKNGADDLPLPVAVRPAQSSVVVKSSIPGASAAYGAPVVGVSGTSSPVKKKFSPSPPNAAKSSGAPTSGLPSARPGSSGGKS